MEEFLRYSVLDFQGLIGVDDGQKQIFLFLIKKVWRKLKEKWKENLSIFKKNMKNIEENGWEFWGKIGENSNRYLIRDDKY